MSTKFKLLLPIGLLPDDATLTLAGGQKLYHKRTEVKIYYPKSSDYPLAIPGVPCTRTVAAEPGVIFLVNERGDIKAVPTETEVVWNLDLDELEAFVESQREDLEKTPK